MLSMHSVVGVEHTGVKEVATQPDASDAGASVQQNARGAAARAPRGQGRLRA